MAYYFTVETKRGEFQPIDIKNSIYFQNINRKFKKPCAYSLDEIDNFTMMFDDETELRERLTQEGTLPLRYFDKPLSIRYCVKDEYIKVPNDFLYQKDLEFVNDPPRLVKHILRRYYDNDFLLIKRIVNKFSEHRRCQSTIPEVRQFIEISIRDGKRCTFLDEIDENGDNLIIRLIKLIILESYDNYKTGKVIYKDKLNYRNLHDLIALIRNYDKELEKQSQLNEPSFSSSYNQTNNTLNEPSELSEQKNIEVETIKDQTNNKENENIKEEKPVYVKTRKLGRKKYNLDNQTSFDI